MSPRLTEETLFWMRLAAFASLSEYVLSTGASADDAEDFLLGLSLPTSLPSRYACLSGGAANSTVFG
jgi:hypothetical protein